MTSSKTSTQTLTGKLVMSEQDGGSYLSDNSNGDLRSHNLENILESQVKEFDGKKVKLTVTVQVEVIN